MDRRQVELIAAQVALENLRQHDQLLKAENEVLKVDHKTFYLFYGEKIERNSIILLVRSLEEISSFCQSRVELV